MRLLRLAIESRRWDLAGHIIVLAAATIPFCGGKTNAVKKQKRQNKKC